LLESRRADSVPGEGSPSMVDAPQRSDPDPLAEAQATIARQANELERLQRRLEDERFAEELRAVLVLAAAAGTIASPVTHARLLQLIVETAADVIDWCARRCALSCR
jgi:hypothetical protein